MVGTCPAEMDSLPAPTGASHGGGTTMYIGGGALLMILIIILLIWVL